VVLRKHRDNFTLTLPTSGPWASGSGEILAYDLLFLTKLHQ